MISNILLQTACGTPISFCVKTFLKHAVKCCEIGTFHRQSLAWPAGSAKQLYTIMMLYLVIQCIFKCLRYNSKLLCFVDLAS